MNILLMNWRDPLSKLAGGAEKVTLVHVQRWIEAGHTVTWLASRTTGSPQTEIYQDINIVRIGNSFSHFFYAPFYYLLHAKDFDLVIDEIHGIPHMIPFFVSGKKLAIIHEVAGEIWKSMYLFPLSWIGIYTEKFLIAFYKRIPFITVSKSTMLELQKMGIKKITVIQNGFIAPKAAKIVKEKYPTFIFVSRLVKMKGIEDVIAAFKIIQQKQPNAKLWIVGDGSDTYLRVLHKLVNNYDLAKSIIFFGKVDEEKKYELLRRSHLLLHASVKEGWGLVVIEAASQSTPTVAYNVGGLRDSVKKNTTGILTDANTPDDLAQKALELFSDTKKYQLFQKNGKDWSASLSWDRATSQSLQLIEQL